MPRPITIDDGKAFAHVIAEELTIGRKKSAMSCELVKLACVLPKDAVPTELTDKLNFLKQIVVLNGALSVLVSIIVDAKVFTIEQLVPFLPSDQTLDDLYRTIDHFEPIAVEAVKVIEEGLV